MRAIRESPLRGLRGFWCDFCLTEGIVPYKLLLIIMRFKVGRGLAPAAELSLKFTGRCGHRPLQRCAVLFDSSQQHFQRKKPRLGLFSLERLMGVEPTCQAWEACILPMNYSRIVLQTV